MFHADRQITHTHTQITTHKHTHLTTHTHTHTRVNSTYLHVTKAAGCATGHQYTNLQIYTTVTQENTINPVQNNKTQITFIYKQFICTQTAVCSLVFECGCST